jgi:signal transduction histidine kinase
MGEFDTLYNKNRHYTKSGNVGRTATFEKIKHHYMTDDDYEEVLTETELTILKRWKTAYSLMMKHNPIVKPVEIVRLLISLFDVSERQAYRDIKYTQELFGDLNVANKAFMKVKMVSWLEELVSLANAKHDFKTSVEAIRQIVQILGLDQVDLNIEDESPRNFQLNIIVQTAEGDKRVIQDLDSLDEIPLSDFTAIESTLQRPRLGVSEMEKILNEDN